MDLSFNLAPSYRDLKDPSTRQNFEDTVEQKRVIDLIACRIIDVFSSIFVPPSVVWGPVGDLSQWKGASLSGLSFQSKPPTPSSFQHIWI